MFDEDAPDPAFNFRAGIKECIDAKMPIFPNRKLGLEFAAEGGINAVRGIPIASVTLANLRVGEGFVLFDSKYELVKIGAFAHFNVTARGGERSTFRTGPDAKNWGQFGRDIEGLIMGSYHGVDAGDLLRAWARDPWSQ